MNAYKVTFKKGSTAHKTYTWTRFAATIEDAHASAQINLDETFWGGIIVKVEPTNTFAALEDKLTGGAK